VLVFVRRSPPTNAVAKKDEDVEEVNRLVAFIDAQGR
jgi:hypothetical protein